MTLLSSVNSVLRLLRRGEVTETSASNLEHQTLIGLLNDAARDVLDANKWSCLKRYDGFAYFPAKFDATTGGNWGTGTSQDLNVGGANSWASSDVTDFTTSLRAKLVMTNSGFPDTSFVVTDLVSSSSFAATISQALKDTGSITTNAGTWEMYAHEFVLPSTVRQVLSVFDQEGNLDVTFVDRDLDLSWAMLRPHTHAQDRPDAVFVGGVYTTTTADSGTATTGQGVMIWPPPSGAVQLQYNYIYQFADLTSDSQSWDGVTDDIVKLIEWTAFEKALDSNVQADPEAAARLHIKNQRRLLRLKALDGKAVHKRNIPSSIGNSRTAIRHPNWRWDTDTVPDP